MLKDCSPTCETQPPTIWPTAAGSTPARSTAARCTAPRRSAGCSPRDRPCGDRRGTNGGEDEDVLHGRGFARSSRRVKPAAALPPADLPASKARHMARRAVEDARPPCDGWTVRDSEELYSVRNWGAGFFTVNDQGHVEVRPRADGGPGIDLLDLVRTSNGAACARRCWCASPTSWPAASRGLAGAFDRAIAEYGYKGSFRGVYPDQGEPAAPRGRGDRRVRRRRRRRARGRAASPSCWSRWRCSTRPAR